MGFRFRRSKKKWKYQALREIAAEPDFYEPFYDTYYADAFNRGNHTK